MRSAWTSRWFYMNIVTMADMVILIMVLGRVSFGISRESGKSRSRVGRESGVGGQHTFLNVEFVGGGTMRFPFRWLHRRRLYYLPLNSRRPILSDR